MVQHLSIRVPWHDNSWKGTVCKKPEENQVCRILKNIAENKDDETEVKNAGMDVNCESDFNPPCISDSGMFMSAFSAKMAVVHPYKWHKKFKHIMDTDIKIEPYNFIGIPYRWTLKKHGSEKIAPNDIFFTQYDKSKELNKIGDYTSYWINNGDNQRNIFEYFYNNVKEKKSILVAYGPTVPFIETPGKVIMGIGVLDLIGKIYQYDYNNDNPNNDEAYIWERQLGHSIRENRKNGFLFPFKQIQSFLKEHPEENPDELIVKIPEEYYEEFSYVTEHLSHDALIQVLNRTIKVLKKYIEIELNSGNGADWDICIDWCKKKLKEVWKDRGAYPGLGAVLTALRIPYGFDIANVIKSHFPDEKLWENLPKTLENIGDFLPKTLKPLSEEITKTKIKVFLHQYEEKKSLIELLSRFTLSLNQAKLVLGDNNLKNISYMNYLTNIHKNNEDLINEIIENPYILYEKTRLLEEKYRFGIGQIDYALFLNDKVKELFPEVPEPSRVVDSDDERRLRAIAISILESQAQQGNTWELIEDIANEINEFRSDVENIDLNISTDALIIYESEFKEELNKLTVIIEDGDEKEEKNAYQLNRYVKIGDLIRSFVEERVESDLSIDDNWKGLLNKVLKNEDNSEEKYEEKSREEKVKIIEKLGKSQISVLTGSAGTGKTTTIVALCKNKSIQNEGILVLAPTGKARVVLSQKLTEQEIKHEAMTLFQYLLKSNHCDTKTWSYYLSGKKDSMTPTPNTIIIDESSMLSEDMFGAFIEAAQSAKRIVFVGDPNQLPPIGAGKPFWELVNYLKKTNNQQHYANITYSNRQKTKITPKTDEKELIFEDSGDRIDVEFSKFFTEDQVKEGDMNNIFDRIKKNTANIEFKHFKDSAELRNILTETICEISKLKGVYDGKINGMKNVDDIDGFDFSIGGKDNRDWMNFNDAKLIDSWQIITPYKNNQTSGSSTINRIIQQKYKPNSNKFRKYKTIVTKKPLGNDAIIYGEKIINIRNQDRSKNNFSKGYPIENCQDYIANGEIGIVTRIWQKPKDKSYVHHVMFSSQLGFSYKFSSNISENDSDLELAYALTVHKAQGSGFKATIFIINEPEKGPEPFISRELIYTALSRQTEKVYILYNKKPWELKKYANLEFSDLARRKTNLFNKTPKIRKYESKLYDYNLIHITLAGDKVRSKSEVIIANLLHNNGHDYIYEKPLELNDKSNWLPDFTLKKSDGTYVYWEHLGMMNDINYRNQWEKKRKSYMKNGISKENGNLIVTEDDSSGGINSQLINEIINEKFLDSNETQSEINSVKNIILKGESQYTEFKETLCWDVNKKQKNDNLTFSALKTVVGFLNSKGGTLLIGVDDYGNIKGLNVEIKKVHKRSKDEFLKFWKNKQKDKIGSKYYDYIEPHILEVNDKIILQIECRKSPIPCYLKDKNEEKFFVRANPATDELKGKEIVDYVSSHFDKY